MSWQYCPVCQGSGLVFPTIVLNSTLEKYSVCNGNKIINTLTGEPPISEEENIINSKSLKMTKQKKIFWAVLFITVAIAAVVSVVIYNF